MGQTGTVNFENNGIMSQMTVRTYFVLMRTLNHSVILPYYPKLCFYQDISLKHADIVTIPYL
jgi:hypothetical protein